MLPLLVAAITALACVRGVSSIETTTGGSKFANGKSRRDALIGYTETSGTAGSGGGARGDDAGTVAAEVPFWCHDENESDCPGWAKSGECTNNVAFMNLNCKVSCGTCVVKRKIRARDGPRVFLDVTMGDGNPPGRIVLDLFAGMVKSPTLFMHLDKKPPGYILAHESVASVFL